MDVSCLFGTWEMLLDQSFLPPLLLWQHDVRVQSPTWFDSRCFADTLLLIVPHVHMCKFLGVGEEFIVRRKIFWIPEYFLVFLGLVGIYIKTYFILRYARYVIKSDYLNLIFELCLKFFYLISYLKQNKLNPFFCFLSFEFFFLGPEEVLRLFANLHALLCCRSIIHF